MQNPQLTKALYQAQILLGMVKPTQGSAAPAETQASGPPQGAPQSMVAGPSPQHFGPGQQQGPQQGMQSAPGQQIQGHQGMPIPAGSQPIPQMQHQGPGQFQGPPAQMQGPTGTTCKPLEIVVGCEVKLAVACP